MKPVFFINISLRTLQHAKTGRMQRSGTGRRRFLRNWLRRLLVPTLICLLMACMAELLAGTAAALGQPAALWNILLTSIVTAPAMLLFYKEDRPFRRKEVWSGKWMAQTALSGAAASFGGSFFVQALRPSDYNAVAETLFRGQPWLVCAALLLASPFAEELYFRGILYQRMREKLSPPLSGLFSAAMFGLYHGNMGQGLYGFFMGLWLAFLMERCQTVKAPMLFHAAANGTALLFGPLLR